MSMLVRARGKCLPKVKASRRVAKAHSLNGDPHAMITGSHMVALKGHHCPKYHPRRQPGRCAICGSTRHPTSQCTRPVKPKAKQAEWDETVGDWAETEWQDGIKARLKSMRPRKERKAKGKDLSQKGSQKGRLRRSLLLHGRHSLHRRRMIDPNPRTNQKHVPA